MEKIKKKKTKKKRQKWDDLGLCKYCDAQLGQSDLKLTSKKFVSERYGLLWTGQERVHIHISRVTCPNPSCHKSYSAKEKVSSFFYK